MLVEKFGFTRQHSSIERAATYLLSFQTDEGDLRGIYGNQCATTYVGAILEVLIKAGYADDPRIANALAWLLAMRQSDGGWAIPVRTVGVPFPEFVDVERHPEPLGPDRAKPSSHLVTGMVLRAFAAHPAWLKSVEVREAGKLLATRLYTRDAYTDRGDVTYWERVSYPFWFTDIVSSLDTLSRQGVDPETPTIFAAMARLREPPRAHQPDADADAAAREPPGRRERLRPAHPKVLEANAGRPSITRRAIVDAGGPASLR